MQRARQHTGIRIDQPVFTADGKHLGWVKEVAEERFKVDAPWQRDYWVDKDVVLSDADALVLDVSGDRIDDIKRDEPADSSIPERHRARRYDETWVGPDYLGPARRWDQSPREPDFSYAQWQYDRGDSPRVRRPQDRAWDEPRAHTSPRDAGMAYGQRAPRSFTGRGPKSYTRPDDRIYEDVCDSLMQAGPIDASDLEVEVKDGEVTLRGRLDTRLQKRMAEDIVSEVPGVKDVHNEIKAVAA